MTKKSMSTLFTALFLLLAEAALILFLSYPVIRPGEVYSPDLDALSGRYGFPLALAGSVGPENSEKVCEYPRKG